MRKWWKFTLAPRLKLEFCAGDTSGLRLIFGGFLIWLDEEDTYLSRGFKDTKGSVYFVEVIESCPTCLYQPFPPRQVQKRLPDLDPCCGKGNLESLDEQHSHCIAHDSTQSSFEEITDRISQVANSQKGKSPN